MIVVIFEYRLREDADRAAYSALSRQLHEVIEADPRFGYITEETSTREDGTVVALEWFESWEGMAAWRSHPPHREAQRRGREEFYAWYRIRTCSVEGEREYTARVREEVAAPAP